MKKNKKNTNQKYKKLLIFDIIFVLINGLAFASTTSSSDYGILMVIVYLLLFAALISIFHGYVTYTKIHSFFIPHLFFYISWVVSLLPLMFLLPTEDIDDLVDIFKMASIFLLLSCFGALVAKIVMIFKKRFSSAEANDVCQKDKYSEKSNMTKSSEIVSNAEDATPYDHNAD